MKRNVACRCFDGYHTESKDTHKIINDSIKKNEKLRNGCKNIVILQICYIALVCVYDAKIVLSAMIHAENVPTEHQLEHWDIVIAKILFIASVMIHPGEFNYNHLLGGMLRHFTV